MCCLATSLTKTGISISSWVRDTQHAMRASCYARPLTFSNAAFADLSVPSLTQTVEPVVAWEKLLHVDTVAVFNGSTSVVFGLAFIDIWREREVDLIISCQRFKIRAKTPTRVDTFSIS